MRVHSPVTILNRGKNYTPKIDNHQNISNATHRKKQHLQKELINPSNVLTVLSTCLKIQIPGIIRLSWKKYEKNAKFEEKMEGWLSNPWEYERLFLYFSWLWFCKKSIQDSWAYPQSTEEITIWFDGRNIEFKLH